MTIRHTLDNTACWHGGDEGIACRTGMQTYSDEGPTPVTAREIELLAHLVDGKTNKQIASAMHLSPMTIKTHISRISRRTGIQGRVALAVWALRSNIVN